MEQPERQVLHKRIPATQSCTKHIPQLNCFVISASERKHNKGYAKMLHEISKSEMQQLAEAEVKGFREALGPFVTAAEATRMPMMFTSAKPPSHPIIFVNQAFLNLTGYGEHEVMGHSFFALLERSTDPEMLTQIQTAFKGGRDLESLVRYQLKDGRSLWITLNIAPVRNTDGAVVQYFASFIDVTLQKEEENRLRLFVERLNEKIEGLEAIKSS